jgi:hypothetical protein
VSGFRTPEGYHGQARPDANVPFKSRATSVRRMPERGKALDLTRMVQYCNENSAKNWLHPRDYDKLLELLGGPLPVRAGNLDRATFEE